LYSVKITFFPDTEKSTTLNTRPKSGGWDWVQYMYCTQNMLKRTTGQYD